MKLSQIKPIKPTFHGFAVPNQGSLIIYHIGVLTLTPHLHQRAALPRSIAIGSRSRPLPNFQFTKQLSQNLSVTQCMSRVAKLLSLTLSLVRRMLFKALDDLKNTYPAKPFFPNYRQMQSFD